MDAHHHIIPSRARMGHLAVTLDELIVWGEALGHDVHPPLLITLTGDLGTGKTTLAQAICRGYGVTEEVTSPTYAIVHEYAAPRTAVYHIDLYRVQNADELRNIGWEDIIAAHALVIIEWPERVGAAIPAGHLPIALDYVADDPSSRFLLAG